MSECDHCNCDPCECICECGRPLMECNGRHEPQQGDSCPYCPGVLYEGDSGRVFCDLCGWSPGVHEVEYTE